MGGMMTKPETIPMPCWGYYFNVAGFDAAVWALATLLTALIVFGGRRR